MGSKKHRNHTHDELMAEREADSIRRGRTKAPERLGRPHNPGVGTILFNPFRSKTLSVHKGIVVARAPLPKA